MKKWIDQRGRVKQANQASSRPHGCSGDGTPTEIKTKRGRKPKKY